MDLPNLTPTPDDGLSTEVALNSSNVSPLIKDNEPTQIFDLPIPAEVLQNSTSNINQNPVDVVNSSPVVTNPEPSSLESSTTEQNQSEPIFNTPRPIKNKVGYFENVVIEEIKPILITPRPIKSKVGSLENVVIEERKPILNTPRPIKSKVGSFDKVMLQDLNPTLELRVIKSEPKEIAMLDKTKNIIPMPVLESLISECGNSFSLPNEDKENSYTNYWIEGTTYYMQTTSPIIKTIPIKISGDLFIDGCKKLQAYKLKNS
jgi:hypothetical protein